MNTTGTFRKESRDFEGVGFGILVFLLSQTLFDEGIVLTPVYLCICYLAKTKFLQDMLVTLYVFFFFFFCLCVIIGFVPV